MRIPEALVAEVTRLVTAGGTAEALLLVNRLAATGDATALSLLADWRMGGGLLPQDASLARDLRTWTGCRATRTRAS
jgi:hypothetical protein